MVWIEEADLQFQNCKFLEASHEIEIYQQSVEPKEINIKYHNA
jgi:hypothetical protein